MPKTVIVILGIGVLAALIAILALFVPALATWHDPADAVSGGAAVAGILTWAGGSLFAWSKKRQQKWLEFSSGLAGVMVVVSGVWFCLQQWFSVLEGL